MDYEMLTTESGGTVGWSIDDGKLSIDCDDLKVINMTAESTRRLAKAMHEHFHPPIRVAYCPDVASPTAEELEELSRSRGNWMALPPQVVEFIPGNVIVDGQVIEPGMTYHFPVDGGVAKVMRDTVKEPPVVESKPRPKLLLQNFGKLVCEDGKLRWENPPPQVEEPLIVDAERTEGA